MKQRLYLPMVLAIAAIQLPIAAEEVAGIEVNQDVVYGHKLGLAMTLDVLTPKEQNGAAAVFMVSGGWVSKWSPAGKFVEDVMDDKARNGWGMLLDRGFTLFLVRHGSSPKFKVPEAVEDVRRAIRFVRHRANDFGIDANRIGVFGGSAGGHLSLMLGTTSDDGDEKGNDEVEAVSNRVAAVVAYFPPTDLTEMVSDESRFPALQFDQSKAHSVSPLFYVTPDDAPTLLLHGGQDKLVPLKHSEEIYAGFRSQGVPAELITFPEAGHGFRGEDNRAASEAMVRWFESHLTLKGGLAGTWDAIGVSPEGEENDSVFSIVEKDGSLSAKVVNDDGEFEVDSITIAGSKVVLSKKFDNDEGAAVIKVEASEKEPGRLVGKWILEVDGDAPVIGDWRATKRSPVKLAGKWLATAVTADGETHTVAMVFEGSGDEFGGATLSENGERREFDSVKVTGKNVSILSSWAVDDAALTMRSKAEEQPDHSLKGTWAASKGDGEMVASGTWTAEREAPPAEEITVVGEWDLEMAFGDQHREYGLRIATADDGKALKGVFISPNSGEHQCKSVEYAEGKLTLLVDRKFEGNEVTLKYHAQVEADGTLKGEFEAVGYEERFNGSWTGKKQYPGDAADR